MVGRRGMNNLGGCFIHPMTPSHRMNFSRWAPPERWSSFKKRREMEWIGLEII